MCVSTCVHDLDSNAVLHLSFHIIDVYCCPCHDMEGFSQTGVSVVLRVEVFQYLLCVHTSNVHEYSTSCPGMTST